MYDKPNEGYAKLLRFYVVGCGTSIVCWLLYELFYALSLHGDYRVLIAWALSYGITSVLCHALHQWFTFHSQRRYWSSLWRTVFVYGCALVLSSIVDFWLAEQMHHRLAWCITMLTFGIVNFFALRYYAYREDMPNVNTPFDRKLTEAEP